MQKHVYVGTIAEICLKLQKDMNSFGRCTVAQYIMEKEHEERISKSIERSKQKKIEDLISKLAVKTQVVEEYAINIEVLNGKLLSEMKYGAGDFATIKKYREELIDVHKKEIAERLEKNKLEKILEELTNEGN